MKVLIVEDDENKRTQLLSHIRSLYPEWEMTERRSYQSGLKELLEGMFDVVLLDMSMPTYDKSPKEPGGRPRPFAGKEILGHIQRRGIQTPVLVVTQFDSFGEGGSTISLAELKDQLSSSYSGLYLGTVYYSAAQSRWQAELKRLLSFVGAKKGTRRP